MRSSENATTINSEDHFTTSYQLKMCNGFPVTFSTIKMATYLGMFKVNLSL